MHTRTVEHRAKRNGNVKLHAIEGHFATQHSHVTHCIDMTQVKSQMNMAKQAARLFAEDFGGTPVDTIITLERTKMIGAFLASELSHSGVNLHQDISVISPEIRDDKLLLRDNFLSYVEGKHVLLLTATSTTGLTLRGVLDGIRYYGGEPVGVAALFGGNFELDVPFARLFGVEDIEGYASYSAADCPLCRANVRVDAVVNSYGYSKIPQ